MFLLIFKLHLLRYVFSPIDPYFIIYQLKVKLYVSPVLEVRRNQKFLLFEIPDTVAVCGDIKIECINKPKFGKKVSFSP